MAAETVAMAFLGTLVGGVVAFALAFGLTFVDTLAFGFALAFSFGFGFLVSDEGAWIRGQVLNSEGGFNRSG